MVADDILHAQLARTLDRVPFRALLGADPDVSARLDATALDAAFDLDHHLRHAPAILERALGRL